LIETLSNLCVQIQLIRKLQEIHGEDNQNKDGTKIKRIIVRVGSGEGEGDDDEESAYADVANDSDPDFDAASAEGEPPSKRTKVVNFWTKISAKLNFVLNSSPELFESLEPRRPE
jgi:hypothetical protein